MTTQAVTLKKCLSKAKVAGQVLVSLHPVVILVFSLTAGVLLFFCSFTTRKALLGGNTFLLSRSKSFSEIVKCTDTAEGLECFTKYRPLLDKEISQQFASLTKAKLENCLDVVSQNANDIALLLNIQTCFHQADIFERADELYLSNRLTWTNLLGILASLALQTFIAFYSFTFYIFKGKETRHLREKLYHLRQEVEQIQANQEQASKDTLSFLSNTNKEISLLSSRYTESEENSMSIKRINSSIESIWYSIKKLRELVLSHIQFPQTLSSFSETPLLQLSSTSTDYNHKAFYDNYFVSNKGEQTTSLQVQQSPVKSENLDFEEGQDQTSSASKREDLVDLVQTKSEENKTVIKASLGGKVFDLNSPQGRMEWHRFIKSNSTKSGHLNCEQIIEDNIIEGNENLLVSQKNEQVDLENTSVSFSKPKELNLTLEEIKMLPKVDKNGKPFRRIFVPGYGWVSSKKLQPLARALADGANKENMAL